jgi:4-amino-4-deoxy-L-arabinose transferase-like glycosyltransferase
MKAWVHVLVATVLMLLLALAYIKYVDPVADTVRPENHVAGVSGRGAIDDEADYLRGAKNILEGHGYSLDSSHPTAIRQPLYSIYLAGFFWAFGTSVGSALLANACALTLLPLLAFLITESFLRREAAILAAYLCVLDPDLYYFGVGWAYSDILFAAFLCAGMALWLHIRKGGVPYPTLASAAAGCLFGAAALTRSGFLLFPFLLAGGELCSRHRKNLRLALVLCAAALFCLIPWAIRNEKVLGSPLISCTNDGITLLGTALSAAEGQGSWNNPASVSSTYASLQVMPDEIARNRQARQLGLAKLREIPPAKLAKVVMLRVARTWVPYTRLLPDEIGRRWNGVFTVALFPVILFTLVGSGLTFPNRHCLYATVPLVLLVVYVTALAAAAWGSTRFRMPVEPMLAGFAASGLLWGWDRMLTLFRAETLSPSPKLVPEQTSESRAQVS